MVSKLSLQQLFVPPCRVFPLLILGLANEAFNHREQRPMRG